MAMTSGFFNANLVNGEYDRKYTAEQLADFFAQLVRNGVSATPANSFKVYQSTGMNVLVRPGFAWINGFWCRSDTSITKAINPASTVRTDFIALVLNYSARTISVEVIQGTQGSIDDPYYDDETTLILARVQPTPGASQITTAMIEDLRSNENYCGIVNTFSSLLIPAGSIQSTQLANRSVTPEKLNLSTGFSPDGPINLTAGVHYFSSESDLPSPGHPGRLYFVKLED